MFHDFIMGYVHINDILQAIKLPAKEGADKSKKLTVNSITYNRKISSADFCKASKKQDVKEGDRKDILTQNMQK